MIPSKTEKGRNMGGCTQKGSPNWSRGSEQALECSGKDGYTVKKLIALLLVAVFVSTSIVGCGGGETKTTTKTSTPPAGGGAGGAGGGATPPGK
jgi:hypothetical protein